MISAIRDTYRRHRIAVVSALLLFLVYVLNYGFCSIVTITETPFDSPSWKKVRSAAEDRGLSRFRMVGDFIESCIIKGSDRSSIEELLGPSFTKDQMRTLEDVATSPQTTTLFSEYEWDSLYWIGQEPDQWFNHRHELLEPEEQYLIIRFGKDSQFESWYIYGSHCGVSRLSEAAQKRFRKSR